MNAKPNVADAQHKMNLKTKSQLEAEGYKFHVSSQGYSVNHKIDGFVTAASLIKRPHGRYAEANRRDFLVSAVSYARRHQAAKRRGSPEKVLAVPRRTGNTESES